MKVCEKCKLVSMPVTEGRVDGTEVSRYDARTSFLFLTYFSFLLSK